MRVTPGAFWLLATGYWQLTGRGRIEAMQGRAQGEPEQRGPGRPLQRRPAPYLRQWMRAHGQRGDRVAEAIGLNPQQMYRKLNGAQPFSLTQARAIARF